MSYIINFQDFWELLPLVSDSLLAAAILALVAGMIGPLVQARDGAFAVHGTSEISFAGASAALFFGVSVSTGALVGALVAAVLMATMSANRRATNALIGVLLPFCLGFGVLFLSLFKGRSSNKFGLLTGQIVSVDRNQLLAFTLVGAVVLVVALVFWRPLFFSAIDPVVARSRGVNVGAMNLLFMVLLALVTALSVQMVGALLVLSLLITPAAAAVRVSANPWVVHALSVVFAFIAAEGGILLSLGPGLPISPYITSISFAIYLVCALVGWLRQKQGWNARG